MAKVKRKFLLSERTRREAAVILNRRITHRDTMEDLLKFCIMFTSLRCCHGRVSAKCTQQNQPIYSDKLPEAFCAPPITQIGISQMGINFAR